MQSYRIRLMYTLLKYRSQNKRMRNQPHADNVEIPTTLILTVQPGKMGTSQSFCINCTGPHDSTSNNCGYKLKISKNLYNRTDYGKPIPK